ncbi:MAG: hypothetical protein HYT03_02765 [Candidatus Harrisonbacteria bacterium]|nr:hypothetical protein [Candidatus Harrisonbacteria bacterium]
MSFSAFYLIIRFFYRVFEFIRHWYVDGFFAVVHKTLTALERLDRSFALKITLRNLFKPLYQDYNFLGYLLGFIFRTGRILIGGAIYLFIVLTGAAIYLAWAAAPIYLIVIFGRQS